MRSVLLSGVEADKFPVISCEVAQLPDVRGWDETAGNEVVFENVGNPLGVFLVGFLPPNGLDILWMHNHQIASRLKDIPYRNPIFACFFLVGKNKYAKSFKFADINYAVASREDKEAMFLEYSELLNSLDSGATTKVTIT